MRRLWQRCTWKVLFALLLDTSAEELFGFANPHECVVNAAVSNGGDVTKELLTPAGETRNYSSPTVVVGLRMRKEVAWVLMEWPNLVLAGTEFLFKSVHCNRNFGLFATDSDANVTFRVNGTEHTETVPARAVGLYQRKDVEGLVMEISSTANVLVDSVCLRNNAVPVPPVAQTIYGQCSGECDIHIWGGDTTVPIIRTCTNDSTDVVQAGSFGGENYYNGVTCKWTAPDGHRISGAAHYQWGDAGNDTVAAFLPAKYFQYVTPVPTKMTYLLLISAQPGQCNHGSSITILQGASGVYHARLTDVPATTVVECDVPVTAVGHAECPQEFEGLCTETDDMNLIAAVLTSTTTTTTSNTSSTSSLSSTTRTTSTTLTSTSSATSTTSTSATSTSSTTTTDSSTSSTTTSTTSTATTTTSSSSSSSTATTSTTTSTATTPTTTLTTTTSTTATSTTTTSTTTTSTTTFTSTSTTNTSTATSTPTSTSSTTTTSSNTVTSTTSSATNTTTTRTTTELTAAVLVNRLVALEASLVTALAQGNATTTTLRIDGLTVVAAKLDAAAVAAAGGNLAVPLADSEAAVTVPASLFSDLGLPEGEAVVLTAASVDLAAFTSNESELEVASVVNLNLHSLAGGRISVGGLADPIKLALPVNQSAGMQCVYWDEDSSSWSTDGMELGSWDKGVLECKATHLTLFAAVIRGFVNTFACSQVTLLNVESIKELGKGDWHRSVGAVALWCTLASFTLLMSLAAWLDRRRWKQGRRSDENLLVPLQVQQQDEQPKEGGNGGAKRARRSSCPCTAGAVVGGVVLLHQRVSAAVRALMERWEAWCRQDCGAPVDGRVGMFIHHLMSTLLVITARRQVAASLGVSGGVSSLIMEDEDIFDVVLSHHTHELDPADVAPVSGGQQSSVTSTTLAREGAWGQLHQDMEAKIDTFMEASARWSSLPCTIWLVFLHCNPLSMCLVHCAFTSCKQRVLLFIVRITGSLMLTTVFFTSTGVPKKQGRSLDCTPDDPFEIVGRILAVGTASMLIAGIPAFIFRSLCTRGLKKVEYEGCPKWKRQLKIWRMQDWAIWILGSLYMAFCVFFVSLFLANVHQMDHGSWLLSGLTSVAQKIVLVPLAVALMLPLVATVCLQFMSCYRSANKTELIGELRLQFKSRANMNMTVGMI